MDLGTSQVDQSLYSELTQAGVADEDARELARLENFGGSPIAEWLAGLRSAAIVMNHGQTGIDWGMLPSPWFTVGPIIASANGSGPHEALTQSVAIYPPITQSALLSAISTIALNVATAGATPRHTSMTNGPTVQRVEAALDAARYLKPIDPALLKKMQRILNSDQGTASRRRKEAGEHFLDWLVEHGKFIKTSFGAKYFLFNDTRRLYTLATDSWSAFIYLATGCNPASTEFRFMAADCEAAADEGERLDVVKVAHWDAKQEVLRISRFDGSVYRLDGQTIEEEANGDGPVLFDDVFWWASYRPDFSGDGAALDWSLEIPHWESTPEECRLIYRAWWLATFFTELQPTRPLLVLKGEKGSGKSMAVRIMLRFLFGPVADVHGVPDKADAFVAMTSTSHILALDNMDTLIKETRDRIASLATGKIDQVRTLYKTNEATTITYRCWLAITSRTPDNLQRDDLVDRCLLLPMGRMGDSDRTREAKMLAEVLRKRHAWWGDVLTTLNRVVAEVRKTGIPDRGGLRMEDFASLGFVFARIIDQESAWEASLQSVRAKQAEFLLADNVIVQALTSWLDGFSTTRTSLTTRKLYEESKSALFGVDRPDDNWPRSVKSFGRQLAGMQRELTEHLAQMNVIMTRSVSNGNTVYVFSK